MSGTAGIGTTKGMYESMACDGIVLSGMNKSVKRQMRRRNK